MSSRLCTNISKWSPKFDQWLHCLKCLNEKEREKSLAYVFQKDVKSSLIARLLTRYYVCQTLNYLNSDVTISINENKRPFIADHNIDFNISHDGNLIVLVGDINARVGVDVVHVKRHLGSGSINKFLNLMKRQLTINEWKLIELNCIENNFYSIEEQKLINFYRFWCMKESYVKAIGTGIGFSFSRLECVFKSHLLFNSFNLLNDTSIISSQIKKDGILEEEWRFEECFFKDEYIICSAIKKENYITNCYMKEVSPEELLTFLIPLKDEYLEEEINLFSQQWTNFQSKAFKAGDN